MAFPVALAASVLGGFLGGQQKLPSELRNLYNIQARAAKDLRAFSKSVPLSDPGERAALAQARGMLGEQQRQSEGELFASLSPGVTAGQGDFLANLRNQQIGQQSALTMQALLEALQSRRGALLSSAQVAQGAVGAASQPRGGGFDFGALLGQLAQQYAYRGALRGTGGIGGGTGTAMPGRSAPYGLPGVRL